MSTKKILLIDDEKHLCVLMKKNIDFTGGDYDVAYALTGKEGMELVKSFRPDLIFLDINLGDVNGISLIEGIKKVDKKIQIIMLSGEGTHEYVQTAFEAGAVDFAAKPCNTGKLEELIHKHLDLGLEPQQSLEKVAKEKKFTKPLLLDILSSFVAASEAKSKYLKGHAERVAKLAKEIGQKMGLAKAQLEILEYSALLHDIGKMGVRDSILDKNGKINNEEWKEIKKHPVIGTNIIEKVRLFRLEEPNIKHHHESFDGRGYPDGLKGKEIPQGARIIAVADTYDAMTSLRPYKDSRTQEEAINEIEKNSGTQFDPDVVKAFKQIMPKEE